MVPPRALRSGDVDHGFPCQHRGHADGSNLEVITALSIHRQIFTCSFGRESCRMLLFLSGYPSHQGWMAVRGREAVHFTLDSRTALMYLLSDSGCPDTNVACHHSPYEACEFPCNGSNSDVFLLAKPDETLIAAP